jgi:hypothetical protein
VLACATRSVLEEIKECSIKKPKYAAVEKPKKGLKKNSKTKSRLGGLPWHPKKRKKQKRRNLKKS